ncbi:hypothetical protein [Haladaptatus sp. AB643]|uniref:hypothetical protein n=1 Tax=Haladaptatus sp. AB643 TaxID=2934174 RepID=UPI00209C5C15|nr:hypothetical protein [Haladaptatus sp. AB643]MCO8243038.1 hypothetical protein [Haladaptatus sp. AB643]
MNFERYREYPVIGKTIFSDPAGGLYGWSFFAFSVLLAGYALVVRGAKVGILAGGGLLLLSVPNVLPERYYRTAVVLRVIALLYYVALWMMILVYFPNVLSFFEGNW